VKKEAKEKTRGRISEQRTSLPKKGGGKNKVVCWDCTGEETVAKRGSRSIGKWGPPGQKEIIAAKRGRKGLVHEFRGKY